MESAALRSWTLLLVAWAAFALVFSTIFQLIPLASGEHWRMAVVSLTLAASSLVALAYAARHVRPLARIPLAVCSLPALALVAMSLDRLSYEFL